MDAMDTRTWRWWTLLRSVSVLNAALWAATAVWAPLDTASARAHVGLSAIYVIVCGFRSFWPRVDLERTVLIDHPLSSIALGRSAATVAELAFTVQCALFVGGLAEGTGAEWVGTVASVLVPLIGVAQLACWLGVLTLSHLWHAVEELLWGVMMVLLATVFAASWPAVDGLYRALLPLGLLACAGGAFVMLGLDVPMYLRRWRRAQEEGTVFLGIADGAIDAVLRREPTGSWDVWKHEVAWMTPYFSAGVWLSIGMVWL